MTAVISRQSLLLFVARLFRVRRSEMSRVVRMTSLAIVLGWGMYDAFNATQAIFLVQSGPEAYPLFFILLALTVWPAVAVQGALVRRFGVGRAFSYNLLANAVIPVLIYLVYRVAEAQFGVAFALYIGYSVAFELVMLLFWSFVSQHFNLLEGKRIYPVIAAGSSVGYTLAGVTTTLVTPVAGTESLMFFWGLGAGIAGLIVYMTERRLYRPAVEVEADVFAVETQQQRHSGRLFALVAALRYLRKSKLVLAFVVIAGLLVITTGVSPPAQRRLGSALPAPVAPKPRRLLAHSTLPGAAIVAGSFCGGLGLAAPHADLAILLAVAGVPLGILFLAAGWRIRSQYVS